MATEAASRWSWTAPSGDDSSEDTIADADAKRVATWTIKECRDKGPSIRETAEYVPFAPSAVSTWWSEYQEGDEKRGWMNTVETVVA